MGALSVSLRRQVNEAIDTAIARAGVDREWVHRHFIHHHDASYLVIPNLYGGDPADAEENCSRALAMNHLAGVLSDLKLVRWPTPKEGKKLRQEEAVASATDLSDIRKKWFKEQGLDPAKAERQHNDRPIRATTGCSPRRSGRWRSPAGASAPAGTSRCSAWSTRRG